MSSPPLHALLLINLGSPSAPTPAALRRYLAEFLGDPCVVDWPRWLWLPILHGIILRTRPARSARLYERVWTADGAPLVATTRAQARALQKRLGEGYVVRAGMRYGSPSIRDAWEELRASGAERLSVLPLFPQESRATTLTARRVVEQLARELPISGDAAAPRWIEAYPDHPGYLEALAAGIERTAAEEPPEHYVFSFHGLPARWVKNGSPYREHCERTARGLARQLQLDDERWTLVFQSKFGPERWLEPSAAELVPELGRRHGSILVACPGFTADCLETTDEIGRELSRATLAAGATSFRLAPCLNEAPEWIEAMARLVLDETP